MASNTLEVKHSVTLESGKLEEVMSTLANQMQELGTALQNIKADTSKTTTNGSGPSQPVNQANKAVVDGLRTAERNQRETSMQERLSNQRLTKSLDTLNSTYKQSITKTDEQLNKEVQQAEKIARAKGDVSLEYRSKRQEMDDARSWQKFAKGALLGGGLAMMYQAGQFGATAGSQSQAINAGAGNYLEFQKQLFNQQSSNQANLATTGILSGTGALSAMAAGSIGGPLGMLAGLGIGAAGAAGSYFINKSSEENKAQNEMILNADLDSWRLQQMGISGKSGKSLSSSTLFGTAGAKTTLTNLQNELYKPENAAFSKDAVPLLLSARRDVIGGMNNEQKASYSTNVQKTAMTIGADPYALSSVVSNVAANTGQDTNTILKQLLKTNQEFGGNTVNNTAKMIQLMQTTPLSAGSAMSLVNKYQYNDAMLANKVNASLASPVSKGMGSIYAKIAGMSDKEIGMLESGVVPSRVQQQYRAAQNSKDLSKRFSPVVMAAAKAVSAYGLDIQANDIGGMKPEGVDTSITNAAPNMPSSFSKFADEVIKALSGINTINATSVYVNGSVEGGGFVGMQSNPTKTMKDVTPPSKIALSPNGLHNEMLKYYNPSKVMKSLNEAPVSGLSLKQQTANAFHEF